MVATAASVLELVAGGGGEGACLFMGLIVRCCAHGGGE